MGMVMNKLDGSFQSTPSAWRETAYIDLSNGVLTISIHSLRMEGDMSSATYFPAWYIFQSTPSAWRETQLLCNVHYFNIFQSTPSAWRETCYFLYLLYHAEHFNPLPPHGGRQWRKCTSVYGCGISIHSLRMEGDLERRQKRTGVRYFNPLPPHGGRQVICVSVIIVFLFQSTPSAWRETVPSC